MTHQDAADTWLALTGRVIFRTFASQEFKDEPEFWRERMRKFVIVVMQEAGLTKKRATKIYDRLDNMPRLQIAEELMKYPDIIEVQMRSPLWAKLGIPPPSPESLCQ